MPLHARPAGTTAPPVAQYQLISRLQAPLPISQVFRAFEDPRNLAKITPSWLRFVIRSAGKLDMRPGLHIDYTIRWLGLPMRWTSVITEYDPPRRFVDEQARGPYAYWHHEHEFTSDGEGTIISDRVSYSLPFGPLGRIAQWVMVGRQLLGIFRFRQRAVEKLLGVKCRAIQEPVIRRAASD